MWNKAVCRGLAAGPHQAVSDELSMCDAKGSGTTPDASEGSSAHLSSVSTLCLTLET